MKNNHNVLTKNKAIKNVLLYYNKYIPKSDVYKTSHPNNTTSPHKLPSTKYNQLS